MRRTLEVIFRRFIRLMLLLALLPLMSLLIAYFLPRSYQTTAKFWAWHTIQSVSTVSQGTREEEIDPQTNVPITPAQSQANTLTQLLQTNDFVLAVAKGTALPTVLEQGANPTANAQQRDEAIFQEISRHVQVVAQGRNLVSVSYISRDASVSHQVVAQVIQHYASKSQSLVLIEGQKLLTVYEKRLMDAIVNTDKVVQAEAQYRLNHPDLKGDSLLADAQYQLIHDQVQQGQALVTSLQTTIAALNQTISMSASPGSLFAVLDTPVTQPISRTILFLIAGTVGLALALLACVVYIFIAVRRDRAVYTAYDLQRVITFPVVMQLPHLSPQILPLLVNGSVRSESKEKYYQ